MTARVRPSGGERLIASPKIIDWAATTAARAMRGHSVGRRASVRGADALDGQQQDDIPFQTRQ
jgi:hypothetical protein